MMDRGNSGPLVNTVDDVLSFKELLYVLWCNAWIPRVLKMIAEIDLPSEHEIRNRTSTSQPPTQQKDPYVTNFGAKCCPLDSLRWARSFNGPRLSRAGLKPYTDSMISAISNVLFRSPRTDCLD